MDASRLLKPVLDSLGNESKLTLADIVASAGNSERRVRSGVAESA